MFSNRRVVLLTVTLAATSFCAVFFGGIHWVFQLGDIREAALLGGAAGGLLTLLAVIELPEEKEM